MLMAGCWMSLHYIDMVGVVVHLVDGNRQTCLLNSVDGWGNGRKVLIYLRNIGKSSLFTMKLMYGYEMETMLVVGIAYWLTSN